MELLEQFAAFLGKAVGLQWDSLYVAQTTSRSKDWNQYLNEVKIKVKLKLVTQVWNRLNSMENYKDIEWNSNDLKSSKQAVRCLLNEGVSEEEILTLDFGNLDVAGVLEELQ